MWCNVMKHDSISHGMILYDMFFFVSYHIISHYNKYTWYHIMLCHAILAHIAQHHTTLHQVTTSHHITNPWYPHHHSHPHLHTPSHSHLPLTSSPSLAHRWSSPHWRRPCLTWTSKRAQQWLYHQSESDKTAFKLSSFLSSFPPFLLPLLPPQHALMFTLLTATSTMLSHTLPVQISFLSLPHPSLPFLSSASIPSPSLTRFLTPPPHRGHDVVYTYMILLLLLYCTYVPVCLPARTLIRWKCRTTFLCLVMFLTLFCVFYHRGECQAGCWLIHWPASIGLSDRPTTRPILLPVATVKP